MLWLLDRVLLGDPARVFGWWCVDRYRYAASGQGERLYGLDVVVGLYGRGKTAYLVYQLEKIRAERGDKVLIHTNFGWVGEDSPIRGWRQMVDGLSLTTPQVYAWDELGSSLTQHDFGKEFPKDLFRLITQMRKGPGIKIICTVQRFNNASIDLRRLSRYIIEVRGYIGSRWIRATGYDGYEEYNDGLPRYVGMSTRDFRNRAFNHWFVFSDYLRSRYDSFRVIEALREYSDEEMAARALADVSARENYVRMQDGRRAGVPAALAAGTAGNGRPSR